MRIDCRFNDNLFETFLKSSFFWIAAKVRQQEKKSGRNAWKMFSVFLFFITVSKIVQEAFFFVDSGNFERKNKKIVEDGGSKVGQVNVVTPYVWNILTLQLLFDIFSWLETNISLCVYLTVRWMISCKRVCRTTMVIWFQHQQTNGWIKKDWFNDVDTDF